MSTDDITYAPSDGTWYSYYIAQCPNLLFLEEMNGLEPSLLKAVTVTSCVRHCLNLLLHTCGK